MFYECEQGRLFGGELIADDKVCHRVIIEANGLREAKTIAKKLGIYFDGVKKGIDTFVKKGEDKPYDRWEGPDEMDLEEDTPGGLARSVQVKYLEKEMESLSDSAVLDQSSVLRGTDPDVRIYYKDGTMKEFYPPRPPKLFRIADGQKMPEED